jgi:hypothetical protein
LRQWRWGGLGFCLGAEKNKAGKMLENAGESRKSTARFVGQPYAYQNYD